ncbi:unnamed protein product, partial [Amoebophrya sp. A120]
AEPESVFENPFFSLQSLIKARTDHLQKREAEEAIKNPAEAYTKVLFAGAARHSNNIPKVHIDGEREAIVNQLVGQGSAQLERIEVNHKGNSKSSNQPTPKKINSKSSVKSSNLNNVAQHSYSKESGKVEMQLKLEHISPDLADEMQIDAVNKMNKQAEQAAK